MANLSDLLGSSIVEVGSSYASGTTSVEIISAATNANGVIISTANLNHQGYGGESSLAAGTSTILGIRDVTGGSSNRVSSVAIAGLKLPAGTALSFTTTGTYAKYHITYEVL